MQIQSTQSQFHGSKINLPIAGTVAIDENGMVEVTEEVAAILLTSTRDWVNPNETDEEEEEAVKSKEQKENVSNDEMITAIDTMSFPDLLAFCEEAKIKGYKKMQANEKALRVLVKNQLAKAGK